MRHLWCVSDLHIADKGPRDKFGPVCEAALVQLIVDFGKLPSESRTLVFNGDTFDFLKIDVAAPEPQRGQDRIHRALTAYNSLISALADFVAAGNRVVWTVGNHDLYIDRPEYAQAFTDRLGRPAGESGTGFAIVQSYFDPDLRVYIEHGCQFDRDNDYGHNGAIPFGSQMVEEVINKWELREVDGIRPFFLIDNVRPYHFLPSYMARLIKKDPALSRYRDEFLEDTAKLMGKAGGTMVSRFEGHLLDGLARLTAGHALGAELIELLVTWGAKADYRAYQAAARGIAGSPSQLWNATTTPTHVVLGHTHYLDLAELSGPTSLHYHNTGTWLENVFLAPDGSIGVRDRICPVLRFEADPSGVRFDSYDAMKRQSIHVGDVVQFYRDHHIDI